MGCLWVQKVLKRGLGRLYRETRGEETVVAPVETGVVSGTGSLPRGTPGFGRPRVEGERHQGLEVSRRSVSLPTPPYRPP